MSNALSLKMMEEHLRVFPKCEYIEAHQVKLAEEDSNQYRCQSYYDDNGHLQACTCGECK